MVFMQTWATGMASWKLLMMMVQMRVAEKAYMMWQLCNPAAHPVVPHVTTLPYLSAPAGGKVPQDHISELH